MLPNTLPPRFRSWPAAQAVPNTLGVNIHLNASSPPAELDRLRDAGFRAVRMDFLWGQIERQPGVYDWSVYDGLIQGLRQRGIRPLVILGGGNPLYCRVEEPERHGLHTPEQLVAFTRFATAAATHYRNQGIVWELWNEPNLAYFWGPKASPNAYMNLARQVLPAMRKADPTATLLAPATAGVPERFLEHCFRGGLLQWVDGVSIHPYQNLPTNRPPEAAVPELERARDLIRRYTPPGRSIPLIFGEWGYATAQGEVNEATQAQYLMRSALLSLAYGAPLNIWYDWKDDGPNPADKEDRFGVVTQALQPKPAYRAMQQLASRLSGQTFAKRLPAATNDWMLSFADPTGRQGTVVVWTAGPPHWATVPGNTQPVWLTGTPQFQRFGEAGLLPTVEVG